MHLIILALQLNHYHLLVQLLIHRPGKLPVQMSELRCVSSYHAKSEILYLLTNYTQLSPS
jgi:hypothetical protein